jgi:type II secretory pathway pseudopilin PulG
MELMMSVKYSQRGDTIVEVLIAIAVASSVLGIVFATSSRNLRATRDIQERGEASRIVQGQIEALRYVASTDSSKFPTDGSSFCMKGSDVIKAGPSTTVPTKSLSAEDFNNYPVDCKSGGIYNYLITGTCDSVFHIYVRWDSLTVSGRDQIQMVYKAN